jgi:hypothetical protein
MLGFKRFDTATTTISGIELAEKLGSSSSRSGTDQVDLYLLLTYAPLFFLCSPANNSPQPSVTTSEKVCTRTLRRALYLMP